MPKSDVSNEELQFIANNITRSTDDGRWGILISVTSDGAPIYHYFASSYISEFWDKYGAEPPIYKGVTSWLGLDVIYHYYKSAYHHYGARNSLSDICRGLTGSWPTTDNTNTLIMAGGSTPYAYTSAVFNTINSSTNAAYYSDADRKRSDVYMVRCIRNLPEED